MKREHLDQMPTETEMRLNALLYGAWYKPKLEQLHREQEKRKRKETKQ